MEIGKDFIFRDDLVKDKNTETVPVQINVGPYAGVVYRYGVVSFKENEEGPPTVKFKFEILASKVAFKEAELRKDKMFVETLGLILNTMLLESALNQNDPSEGDNDNV